VPRPTIRFDEQQGRIVVSPQSSITSAFMAACDLDHERMMRQLVRPDDAEVVSDELAERYHFILALLVRQHEELEAVLKKLGPDEQKAFCEVLSELLVEVTFTGGFMQFRDELLRERREVESAVKVLCSFCARLHRDGLVGEEIGAFIGSLQRLDGMSEFITIHDLDAVSWVVPNSRKARGDFFWRVHFARLFVASMIRIFGRPRYRIVADTINALIEVPDPVTEGSVRDAWRSRPRSGGFIVVNSD
jgi:hypothetical protein